MDNSLKDVGILHSNAFVFQRAVQDGMNNVLCHTGCVACRTDGWAYCFVLLLLCELGDNHRVRQGEHKRCIENVQTRCFITLSSIHLRGKFMADLGDGIQGIWRVVGQI